MAGTKAVNRYTFKLMVNVQVYKVVLILVDVQVFLIKLLLQVFGSD